MPILKWKFPRIRGTNFGHGFDSHQFQESPPHTRDKYCRKPHLCRCKGITPAYAGQMTSPFVLELCQQDHPRIRGTNLPLFACLSSSPGSSPHARDKYGFGLYLPHHFRIIPACAGQISKLFIEQAFSWDHPRMRGTNFFKV